MDALPLDLQGATKLSWAPYAGRNITYFLTVLHLRETYGRLYQKLLEGRFSYLFVEAKGLSWQMYRSPSESSRLEDLVYKKLDQPRYLPRVLNYMEESYTDFWDFSKKFAMKDMAKKTKAELALELEGYIKKLLPCLASVSCSIVFASALGKKLGEKLDEKTVGEIALPLNKTLPLEEEIEFWKLVGMIKQEGIVKISAVEKLPNQIQESLSNHYKTYSWINAYENDPIPPIGELVNRINEGLSEDPSNKLKTLEERHSIQEERIRKLSLTHKINPLLLKHFRQAMYYRILGESMLGLGNYATQALFTAISKKLFLAKNQVKRFSDNELLEMLSGKLAPEKMAKRLGERQGHYLVAVGEKECHCFQGKEVNSVLSQLDIQRPIEEDVKEVKGVGAFPGKVTGIARVVLNVGEVGKVKKGDILVTLNTTPSFIMAMKRAGAIVTDEGGITCHAAIVSRELGIPCIIGTKAGTKIIKDGSQIEVDATNGVVKNV